MTRPFRWARGLSLRTLLLLLVIGAGAYAGAFSVFLYFRVGAPAFALGEGAEALVRLLDDLQRRHDALERAMALARGLASGGRPIAPAELQHVRELVASGSERSSPQPFATVPARLRVLLAYLDDEMAQLGDALTAVIARLELQRLPDARGRLEAVDLLHTSVDVRLRRATQIARDELLERQQGLQGAARSAMREGILWLAVGAFLVPIALYLVRKRVWLPLKDLEAGLARVSEGDLAAEVQVLRMDEAGRLAAHFNEMTRVLRDRAEGQGRFAAAGELLAGVAHEVNNPLMAIAAHAENRLADPALDPALREEMAQILRQSGRASKLLRGLLRFVRVHEQQLARVNLNDVVRGALDLVSYRFRVDEIDLGGRLDARLPPVLADPVRLEQVMVNLLSNAIDALRAVKPPRRLSVDSWAENARVHVAVGDNGRGVAAEFADWLFKPFATTKGSQGTGLGLYISRQIVRAAGGDLTLASGAGEGARFVVSLPAMPYVETAPEAPATAPVAPGAPAAELRGLRVLLVDDEEAIRRPMVRYLTRRGAQVIEAGDGLEALGRLGQEEVDLIIVDLRMPRMGGAALYAKLQEIRPRLAERVLFLSGDISQLAALNATPVPRERMVAKPVELAELERRIVEFVRATGIRAAPC